MTMEFERVTQTVRAAEQLVVQAKTLREGDGRLAVYLDALLVGPWLVMAGATILFRRAGLAIAVAPTMLLFFWVMDANRAWGGVMPALLIAFGSVYFGLPSRTVARKGSGSFNWCAKIRSVSLARTL